MPRPKRRGTPHLPAVRLRIPRARWKRTALLVVAALAVITSGVLGYYYIQFSRIIEARLHGERDRVIPRVFARPLTLHAGPGLSELELIASLNDVGYTEKARVERPGEFAIDRRAVVLFPRGGVQVVNPVRVAFTEPRLFKTILPVPATASGRIQRI